MNQIPNIEETHSTREKPRSLSELDKGVNVIECPSCKKDRLTLVDDYGDWLYGCDTCGEYINSSELKHAKQ